MASRNRLNGPYSLPVYNGTEQQHMDLFQNLEKLIASAVSICRLDGSVQCQIGGLITVIEELQRLLRHSFAEIRRLERNLDDQEHTFTNNITNLHYQVKEVQSNVETLECEFEEAQKCREASTAIEQNNLNETVDDPPQISLVEESYGYGEESDGGSIPNNANLQVENTDRVDLFAGLNEENEEPTRPDSEKEDAMDVTSETDAANDRVPSPSLDKEAGMEEDNEKGAINDQVPSPPREIPSPPREIPSPPREIPSPPREIPSPPPPPPQDTPNSNISNSPRDETATSTSEERESALRVLRSNSNSTSRVYSRSSLSSRKGHHTTSPLVINNIRKSPKTQSAKTLRNKGNQPRSKPFQRSPPKQTTPKLSRKSMGSSKVKKSPAKLTPQQKKALLTKIQRKNPANVKLSRKSSGSSVKKNTKVIAKSPSNKTSPSKLRNGARLSSKRSASPTKINQSKVVSNAKANKATANQRLSKGATANESRSREARANQSLSRENSANQRGGKEAISKKTSTVPTTASEENPMDKYINLDFLLNANQLMSELVTDSNREEGSLDTASEAERRHIVDLAKLYRLRLRMAGKEGELPVALIKGRESSLPKPGQVDRLLYKMTRAMAMKSQLAKSKESAKKHKLSGSRRSMASPAKKRRA